MVTNWARERHISGCTGGPGGVCGLRGFFATPDNVATDRLSLVREPQGESSCRAGLPAGKAQHVSLFRRQDCGVAAFTRRDEGCAPAPRTSSGSPSARVWLERSMQRLCCDVIASPSVTRGPSSGCRCHRSAQEGSPATAARGGGPSERCWERKSKTRAATDTDGRGKRQRRSLKRPCHAGDITGPNPGGADCFARGGSALRACRNKPSRKCRLQGTPAFSCAISHASLSQSVPEMFRVQKRDGNAKLMGLDTLREGANIRELKQQGMGRPEETEDPPDHSRCWLQEQHIND
nr:PREDICTED: uncharacterized protein LOC106488482 [Apteryx mantelli mantelli]